MDGVGAPPTCIPPFGDDLGSTHGGLDGFTAQPQGGSLLQLEGGSDISRHRVLHLTKEQGAGPITLVTPLWPAQHWFPLLLEMVVDLPVILNHPTKTLVLPPILVDKGHVTPPWTMVAWRICGRDSERRVFLKGLSELCLQTGREAQMENILTLLSTTGPLSQQDAALTTRILQSWISSTSAR